MASVGKVVLMNETGLAASTVGSTKGLEILQADLIGVLEVSNSAASNYDVVIQHSPNGNDWLTLATIPNLIGNGSSIINITAAALPNVRANLTRNAGSGDVIVSIFFDKKK
jgi:hypothetical protein